jgi:hypothetical protein
MAGVDHHAEYERGGTEKNHGPQQYEFVVHGLVTRRVSGSELRVPGSSLQIDAERGTLNPKHQASVPPRQGWSVHVSSA